MSDPLHNLSDVALGGAAGRVITKLLPHTEASAAALLFDLYASFGNAVGQAPWFLADGARHRANINVLIVGRTARSRKGTARGVVRSLMSHVDAEWSSTREVGGLSTGEGLIAAAASGQQEGTFDLDGDRRLFVHESEFSRQLSVTKRRDSTLSPVIRQAWDGTPLSILTRNEPLRVESHYISVVAHMTVEELRRWTGSIEAFNGFWNRFLVVIVERSQKLPSGNTLSEAALIDASSGLRAVLEQATAIGEMRRSPEAEKRWAAFYHSLHDDEEGSFGEMTARAEAQVLRLSMIEALMCGSDEICIEHLEPAIAAWSYVEESVRRVTAAAGSESHPAKLLSRLTAAGSVGLTRTEIHGVFNKHLSKGDLDQVIESLAKESPIEIATRRTGGRSVTVVRLATPDAVAAGEANKQMISERQPEDRGLFRFARQLIGVRRSA